MAEDKNDEVFDLSTFESETKMQEGLLEKKKNHVELKIIDDPSEPTGIRSEPKSSAPKKRSKSKNVMKSKEKKTQTNKTRVNVFVHDEDYEFLEAYSSEMDIPVGAAARRFVRLGIQQAKDKGEK
jgi:hypothetical protein